MNRFLALVAVLSFTLMIGCTAEQQAGVEAVANPNGALDTLLNTPVVDGKAAGRTYLSTLFTNAGGLTIAGLLGLFINKPGTKKKTAAQKLAEYRQRHTDLDASFKEGIVVGRANAQAVNEVVSRLAAKDTDDS